MAEDRHYDVFIIGTGAGGGTLAHRLAPSGKRIPGLKLDNPRQLALVRFAQIAQPFLCVSGMIHARPPLAGATGCPSFSGLPATARPITLGSMQRRPHP